MLLYKDLFEHFDGLGGAKSEFNTKIPHHLYFHVGDEYL